MAIDDRIRTVKVRGEAIQTPNKADAATNARDAMAKVSALTSILWRV